MSLHHRRRKRLVLPTIQCLQGFLASLSLRYRPICRHILSQIGDNVAGDLHGGGGPGVTGGKLGIDAGGVIYEVGVKAGGPDLIFVQIPRKLMDQGAHHFQVAQFLSAWSGAKMAQAQGGKMRKAPDTTEREPFYSTITSVPAPMRRHPMTDLGVNFSWRNTAAITRVMTTLSLSMGTTLDTSPI